MSEENGFIEGLKTGKGCGYGAVNREKICDLESNVSRGFREMKDTLKELNNRLFVGIITVIVLSFLSGINVWESLIKLILR